MTPDPPRQLTVPQASTAVAIPAATDPRCTRAPAGVQLSTLVTAPAPGWAVAVIVVIPRPALHLTGPPPAPGAVRMLSAPGPGRCVQIAVMLGEPDAADLHIAPHLDLGAITLADRRRVRLWAHYGPNLDAGPTLPTPPTTNEVTSDDHRDDAGPRETAAPGIHPGPPTILVACGPDHP